MASRGVGLFIDELLEYKVIGKCSNEAFQALWIKISLSANKNIICGIIYRQHNSPEVFQTYFDETTEKFPMTNKAIYIMGDFNIDLLKYKRSHFSHNFLLHPQSCYLIPTVDKPTRVHRASATLIDNILVNNPDKILASGNIVTDVSDHFSQVCVTKSAIDKFKGKLLLINSSTTQNSLLFASMMIFPMLTGITFLVAVKKNVYALFSSFYKYV